MTKGELINALKQYPDDMNICGYDYEKGIHFELSDIYSDNFNDPNNVTGSNLHNKEVIVLTLG